MVSHRAGHDGLLESQKGQGYKNRMSNTVGASALPA